MRILMIVLVIIGIGAWLYQSRSGPLNLDWTVAQKSGDLVDAHGHPCPHTAVQPKPYTFVYFSAGWCPPCHAFTPYLVAFYNDAGPKRDFNIIMVSRDHDADGLEAYADEFHMPWVFARMHSKLAKGLVKTYANSGIPDLVLIDSHGKVLSDSFSGSDYLGPQHVLDDYRKL